MQEFLQQIVNGITWGSVYALIALGYTMVYGILRLIILAVSLLLMLVRRWIVLSTKVGKAMRAVSYNRDAATLMGIDTDRIISFTFVLGACLAAAAGVLVGLMNPKIDPLMGIMPG